MSDPSSQPTQPLTGQPMRPEGGCSLAGPNGTRIPIEEPHSYSFRKGANTIFVRTCDLCGDIDWDALHEATVERVAIEVDRLRAENTAQAAKLGTILSYVNQTTTPERAAGMVTVRRFVNDLMGIKREPNQWEQMTPTLGLDQDGEGQA